MINLSCSAAAMATSAVVRAARLLLSDLEHGRRIDAAGTLRAAMETAFSASDGGGAWHWKTAYDACEAATVLFLRKYASSMRAKAASSASMLSIPSSCEFMAMGIPSAAAMFSNLPIAIPYVTCYTYGQPRGRLRAGR